MALSNKHDDVEQRQPHHHSSTVAARFYALPQIVRYFISSNIANIFFFLLERLVSSVGFQHLHRFPLFVQEHKDSVSFFLAYALQVLPQHLLNAFLVYGIDTINSVEKYIETLLGTYSAVAVAAVGSTILNAMLLKWRFHKSVAFATTLLLFSIWNYIVISWWVVHTPAYEREHSADDPPASSVRGGGGGGYAPSLEECVDLFLAAAVFLQHENKLLLLPI